MDLNVADIGINRIISFMGLAFICILLFLFEKQTNYFYYLSTERKIELLNKIDVIYDKNDDIVKKKINNLFSNIIDEMTAIDLFKINDAEKSLYKAINTFRYGSANATDKDAIIKKLNNDIVDLKDEINRLKEIYMFYGFLIFPACILTYRVFVYIAECMIKNKFASKTNEYNYNSFNWEI